MQQSRDPSIPVKTRVLHVITDLDVGGAERMLVNYVTSSANFAQSNAVFSLKGDGAMAEPLRAAGVDVYLGGISGPGAGLLSSIATAPQAIFQLSRLIRRLRPMAVTGWMYHANVAAFEALRLAGARRSTRLVAGIRCSVMQSDRYSFLHRFVVDRCRRISADVDVLAYNSEAGRREHEALGYAPDKATVVWNGIDTARFQPDRAAGEKIRRDLGIEGSRPVLITAARVDPMKDYDTLLDAFQRLDGGADLIVVGKGTEALPALPGLHRLGIRADMPSIYAAGDVLVMSSAFGEGFPNVVGEGMACGLVPVFTDVGDARVIADGIGLPVPARDPAALGNALRGLLARLPSDQPALSAAARQRIETRFSLDQAVRRMREVVDPAA